MPTNSEFISCYSLWRYCYLCYICVDYLNTDTPKCTFLVLYCMVHVLGISCADQMNDDIVRMNVFCV